MKSQCGTTRSEAIAAKKLSLLTSRPFMIRVEAITGFCTEDFEGPCEEGSNTHAKPVGPVLASRHRSGARWGRRFLGSITRIYPGNNSVSKPDDRREGPHQVLHFVGVARNCLGRFASPLRQSLHYASPEQRSNPSTVPLRIYSLGARLVSLTGAPPMMAPEANGVQPRRRSPETKHTPCQQLRSLLAQMASLLGPYKRHDTRPASVLPRREGSVYTQVELGKP